MKTLTKNAVLMLIVMLSAACDGFLDPKPEQRLVVPTTLADVRALLSNPEVFNRQPALATVASDEYFTTDQAYLSLSESEQGSYIWREDPYQGAMIGDWNIPYQQIFYSNVALEALQKLEGEKSNTWEILKGEALFHRAHAYYQLLQVFAPPFQISGANESLLGVVLKDSPDINDPIQRADLSSSYRKVIDDLNEALILLPENQSIKTQPTKAAALGLLARTYLVTFDYTNAAESAQAALKAYSARLDFNALNVLSPRPFPVFSDEIVFYSELIVIGYSFFPNIFTDSILMKKYKDNDLRFSLYYTRQAPNLYSNTGKLTGNTRSFGGISVGELELIAAEALARISMENASRQHLNSLLSRRFKKGTFVEITKTGTDLLGAILEERRKELIGRGLRWSDLRRLNQEQEFEVTLRKVIAGNSFELSPNSPKYVFPIPDNEIERSGIQQNPR